MMTSKKNIRFPKRELKRWPRKNRTWDDKEWKDLVEELNHSGFEAWVGSPEALDQVGLYLETHRP